MCVNCLQYWPNSQLSLWVTVRSASITISIFSWGNWHRGFESVSGQAPLVTSLRTLSKSLDLSQFKPPASLWELQEATYGSSHTCLASWVGRCSLSQGICFHILVKLTFKLMLQPSYKECHITELLNSSKRAKTANIKTETAWHWRVVINMVQNKCHTHSYLFFFHQDLFLKELLTWKPWEQNLWPCIQIDDPLRLKALNCARSYKLFQASVNT